MELILASTSPRRKELLTRYGFTFKVIPSDSEEGFISFDPYETAATLALLKAENVYLKTEGASRIILGADTVVYFGGEILGKPKDEKDAALTLKKLS